MIEWIVENGFMECEWQQNGFEFFPFDFLIFNVLCYCHFKCSIKIL